MKHATTHRTRPPLTGPRRREAARPAETARLDGAFLERQRYRLRLARDTLVRELANVDVPEGRPPEEYADRAADAGARVSATELEAMLARKLELRLLRTLRALEKIEEGTYGLCDVTGGAIARSRLEQFPEELETERGRRLLRTAGSDGRPPANR